MYKTILAALVFAVVFSPTGRALAQLRWDQPEITLRPTPGERAVETDFKFTNTGAGEVSITKIETSCGCTTAKLDRQTYQAQEGGVVRATFTFAGRVGWQHKSIAVQSTDPSTPVTMLTLHVLIPDTVQLSSNRVQWVCGDAPVAKTVEVTVLNHAMNVTAVSCPDGRFRCDLATVEPGKSYRVTVAPLSTAQADSAFVQLRTDSPDRPAIHFQAGVSDP